MSVKSKATAEVFFTAFKALPKAERDEVVGHMAIARCAATCWIWRPSRSASRNRLAPSTNTSASVAHDNERALVFRTDQTDLRKGNGQPAPFGIRPDRRVDSCVGNRPPGRTAAANCEARSNTVSGSAPTESCTPLMTVITSLKSSRWATAKMSIAAPLVVVMARGTCW